MTDEEITAAALSDPDTLPPSEDAAPFVDKVGCEALADLFPPETVEALLAPRRGRPKSERPKVQFTARFDADIVEHFRNSGNGWQVRMEEVLRKAYRVNAKRTRTRVTLEYAFFGGRFAPAWCH